MAAAQLLTRYQSRVYGLCFHLLGSYDQALDVAQDVLLRAYEHLGSFRESNRFASWIYAITRNRCRSELSRARLPIETEVDPDELHGQQTDVVDDLIQRLDEEVLLKLIHETLSNEEQTVLWLRCVEQVPVDTLTDWMGIERASGARGLLQRARRKLRAALDSKSADGGKREP